MSGTLLERTDRAIRDLEQVKKDWQGIADMPALAEGQQRTIDLLKEVRQALEFVDTDSRDAARFRWLLAGNGYFLEEQMLCGHGPTSEAEREEARRVIDEEMQERR